MKADNRFIGLDMDFWANVRYISQECGYTDRLTKSIKIPLLGDIVSKYKEAGFSLRRIMDENSQPTRFGTLLLDYFDTRAKLLAIHAKGNLMTGIEAEAVFNHLSGKHASKVKIQKNKQSGAKNVPNYFTAIINILIEAHSGTCTVNYGPRELTLLTEDLSPARTLSRQVDGAFPSVINPIAIWEIKEYYHTTSFGSRIADGVYETQLDGLELKEAKDNLQRNVHHYLMVDAYDTWWNMGKPYLCRMCDMLHMGITSEILFGKEVVTRLPELVSQWVEQHNAQRQP